MFIYLSIQDVLLLGIQLSNKGHFGECKWECLVLPYWYTCTHNFDETLDYTSFLMTNLEVAW